MSRSSTRSSAAARSQHAADIFVEGEDFSVRGGAFSPRGQSFSFSSPLLGVDGATYELHLLGAHQVKNAGVAIMTAYLLHNIEPRITEPVVREALRLVTWPGRFEYLEVPSEGGAGVQPVLIDGAHNPAGMEVLRQSLDAYFPGQPRVLLLGILHDKDIDKMLRALVRPEDLIVMTPPQSDRAEKARVLAEEAAQYARSVAYREDNVEALALALSLAQEGRLLVVAGSLYLIGGLRQLLLGKEDSHA